MGISVEIHRVALIFHCFQVKLEFRNVDFCAGRKTGVLGEKPLGARMKTNNKLNPDMTPPGATLVGGECSHHCTIPAPQEI